MMYFARCLLTAVMLPALTFAALAQSTRSRQQREVQSSEPELRSALQAASSPKAKNIILFLADAGGVPVLNAASLYGYGQPLRLHVQQWPHLGLSETSPVDKFVSDSANGMSAIMTGVKTRNGVISQGPDAIRGQKNGTSTKTLLEYAEEHGLMTGVVTSQSIADATPAATYAHASDRKAWGGIFQQAFTPRFGNGVDVMFGAGRSAIEKQLTAGGTSMAKLAARHQRPIYSALADVPAADGRAIVVGNQMDVRAATLKALELLQRAPAGYFLVVEWDAHTDDPREGLQNIVNFDKLIGDVESRVDLKDTLLLFTADHSFGLQVDGGGRGSELLEGYASWKASSRQAGEEEANATVRLKNVMVNATHTAEEVPALAIGAGAGQVRGYFPNTRLFEIMMQAWGWRAEAHERAH